MHQDFTFKEWLSVGSQRATRERCEEWKGTGKPVTDDLTAELQTHKSPQKTTLTIREWAHTAAGQRAPDNAQRSKCKWNEKQLQKRRLSPGRRREEKEVPPFNSTIRNPQVRKAGSSFPQDLEGELTH